MNFLTKYKNYLSLHGVIFLWGFTGILGRVISISSISLVWWRMSFALIGLLIFMILTKRSFITTPNQVLKYLGTGVITAAHWIFFFEALKVSNVSVTLTVLASTSFFVALFEPFFFKRKVMWYELALGTLVIAGLAIIFQAETQHSLGVIYAVISAILAALFGTLNGVFVKKDRPTLITAYEMIGGVLGITIYYAATGALANLEVPVGLDWTYLLILGLICTSLAFVVSIEVLKELSPFTVSISINMEPIYAIIFALLIFKEKEYMSPLFYIGAVMVMSMIFLNSYVKRKQKVRAGLKKGANLIS